ncbi:universal stress protein [Citreimonas salinaria]|uniref:Nucleotide-binding universal stress protein, UspA family n=1 Tax=Citreimonas salinaria TaxID=321339 RepID=A0A1H3L0R4_9RHOB|nr:universal stress protein [Citreimonas salinaria]SDY57819.1 Nucleotide-binding universal stress protein, UspA family [Citreimonas salinaria]
MYQKILIPIAPDHIDAVPESIAAARVLADEGATIHALSVLEVIPNYVSTEIPYEVYERSCGETQTRLEAAFQDLPEAKISAEIGSPSSKILDVVKEGGYDLIVIRSHKPGLQDWFLGSTTGKVLRHAPCSVHVLR